MERKSPTTNLASSLEPWAERRKRQFEANVVTNLTTPDIRSWSWQSIQSFYKVLGIQLEGYGDIADRFELQLPLDRPTVRQLKPGDIVTVAESGRYTFVARLCTEVKLVNDQLNVLDAEISRRSQLIGIMG